LTDPIQTYLLPLPPFLGLAHHDYDPASYELPTKPHGAETTVPDPKFSAYDTATSTIFWRRDPKNSNLLQSNARIVRWDDGSLTLQLGNKPTDHYRISTIALHQTYSTKTNRRNLHAPADYDPNRDSNSYLGAYHTTPGVDLQIARPLDASMRIQPTGDLTDASLLRLQQNLAATTNTHDPVQNLKVVRQDPEEARRRAEQADKEMQRQERKRRNAQEALEFKREQTLRRGGLGGRAGLSIAGLEDDDGMPTARGSKARPRKRKTNRHGEIYSDDEDETLPRGRTREDEYDRDDGFVADSDEDPEVYDDEDELGDDDDEDAEGEEDDDAPAPATRERPRDVGREATPKRPMDDDEGAGMASPQARKKRRVIDDEDDE
jgi:RNA polymerase-associated protein LEO1